MKCKACHGESLGRDICSHCSSIFNDNIQCRGCGSLYEGNSICKPCLSIFSENDLECRICFLKFSRKYNLLKHLKADHHANVMQKNFHCDSCNEIFNSSILLASHVRYHHASSTSQPFIKTEKYAFEKALIEINICEKNYEHNYNLCFAKIFSLVFKELCKQLDRLKTLKFNLSAEICFVKETSEGEFSYTSAFFNSSTVTLLSSEELELIIQNSFEQIKKQIEDFSERGSNWSFFTINYLRINIAFYRWGKLAPRGYIPLPDKLKHRKGLLNIQNNDGQCLIYCILAKRHHPSKNASRASAYHPFMNSLNLNGIEFPVVINQIPKLEKQNNLSINVFSYDDGNVFPSYMSKHPGNGEEIDVLHIYNNVDSHYVLITDFNKFMSSVTNHHGRKYFCRRCLAFFNDHSKYIVHERLCNKQKEKVIEFPKEGQKIRYFEYSFEETVPYSIYADFETILVEPDRGGSSTDGNTTFINKHEISSFCFIIIKAGKILRQPFVYRGKDAGKIFLKTILDVTKPLFKELSIIVPLVRTTEDEQVFRSQKQCYFCFKLFSNEKEKVRHHHHATGQFIGASCFNCNLKCQKPKFIPVFFHNLKSFDAKFIFQEIEWVSRGSKIKIIPKTSDEFMSFEIDHLRFLDSFQFLPASLDSLAKSLKTSDCEYLIAKAVFNEHQLPYMLRKGVFCYDYMDSFEKYNETCLPSKDKFYNSLNNQEISDEEYLYAQQVFRGFECKNLGDFSNTYMIQDTVILSEIFEAFRKMCLCYYGLDPCHFYSLPGFTYTAALKFTRVECDLIRDPNMFLMIESGIRGGLSMVSHRHAIANNKLMKNFNPHQPSSFIAYFDVCNLYGYALKSFLPQKDFQFDIVENFNDEKIKLLDDEGDDGYIFQVDLEYPRHLHRAHDAFPLIIDHLTITPDLLSPYNWSIYEKFEEKPLARDIKLCPNFRKKEYYVVHYRLLKYFLEMGIVCSKIHHVIKFKQARFLESYINFNSIKRMESKTNFERDLFKLIVNSLYGKTIESLRGRINVEIVNSKRELDFRVKKPLFKCAKILGENSALVVRDKNKIIQNRAQYIGFVILDIAKLHMLKWHYGTMSTLGVDYKLLYTDTDSLIYQIFTDNLFEQLKHIGDQCDFSNFPTDHILYNQNNASVPGKMKLEYATSLIREFVGLRAKLYSIEFDNNTQIRRVKGVRKIAVQLKLHHDDFVKVLNDKIKKFIEFKLFKRSFDRVYTVSQRKLALSCSDNKRYIHDNGISSNSYFYDPC